MPGSGPLVRDKSIDWLIPASFMVVYLASVSFLAILADRNRALQYLQTDIVDAVVLEIQDRAAVNVDDYQGDEFLLRIEPAGRDLMFVRSRADRFLG